MFIKLLKHKCPIDEQTYQDEVNMTVYELQKYWGVRVVDIQREVLADDNCLLTTIKYVDKNWPILGQEEIDKAIMGRIQEDIVLNGYEPDEDDLAAAIGKETLDEDDYIDEGDEDLWRCPYCGHDERKRYSALFGIKEAEQALEGMLRRVL